MIFLCHLFLFMQNCLTLRAASLHYSSAQDDRQCEGRRHKVPPLRSRSLASVGMTGLGGL